MIFDTHAHYDDEAFDEDREDLLAQMEPSGIAGIVNMGASLQGVEESQRLSERYPFIYAAAGVHPDYVGDLNEEKLSWMAALCRRTKTGGLPGNIHSRAAGQDTFDLMKADHAGTTGGIIHCFSASAQMALEYVKLGYYIGVGGVVAFKNARVLKEVVAAVPLENIVLETDCPYLAPPPHRGKRNSSLYLPLVRDAIAGIKGIEPEQVEAVTYENARRVYQIA
ncbi:MAG: TatD family hydrolase [Lachnospiraceae bacterium]|nr:TatD family hydrolase [Lachnospiraceae bacterium]